MCWMKKRKRSNWREDGEKEKGRERKRKRNVR